MATGGMLTKAQAKVYRAFQERHKELNAAGRTADKVVRIVSEYLPLQSLQAEETRIYVGRFPHHAKKLLRQARCIRRKAQASRGGTRATSVPPTTARGGTTAATKTPTTTRRNPAMPVAVRRTETPQTDS